MQTKLPTDFQLSTVQLLFSLESFNKDTNKTATYVVNDGLAASYVSADRGINAHIAHFLPIPSGPESLPPRYFPWKRGSGEQGMLQSPGPLHAAGLTSIFLGTSPWAPESASHVISRPDLAGSALGRVGTALWA